MRAFALTTTIGLILGTPALADQLFNDDIITTGNICVGGFECTDGESFGASDIKIKGTIPEVQFNDTSSGDSTWTLSVDDTASGVSNGFSIKNETNADYPFVIQEDAPDYAMFISDTGSIGMGTTIPQASIHIRDYGLYGEPRIRLEDNYGTPYSWEMRGNNSGFYLYDVTGGRTLPFQVRPGAPSSSIDIDNDGKVGMGTSSPLAPLDIRSDSAGTDDNQGVRVVNNSGTPGVRGMLTMINNGGSYFTLDNTDAGTTWYFVHENNAPNRFIITDAVADGPEMTLTADGDLTIPGQLFTAGSCAAGCDRVFDEDYPLPTIAEQAAMMKANKHLPNVGPTPEDGPFNLTAMTGGILNELEKAHLFIAQLNEKNAALEARNKALEAQDAALLSKTAKMEARLAALEALLLEK
ncbi:hypothetical protein ACN2XU_12740 [Primorskyibacter sp. 2E107]|uniref:hypothetical protein n=1 Tax=Primorskyibacter sp. 2E107 TaxID=3403458 RepID=UPI003AF916EC